ncbi:MAG: hypothetical protein U1F43_31810 [Myxococcota bacterium]
MRTPGEEALAGYAVRALTRAFVMRYSPLETPPFARFGDEDVAPITAGSTARSAVRRGSRSPPAGGRARRNQDEHSFAFKLRRVLQPVGAPAAASTAGNRRGLEVATPNGAHQRRGTASIASGTPGIGAAAAPAAHPCAAARAGSSCARRGLRQLQRGRVRKLVDVANLIRRYPAINRDERK